MQTSKRCEKFDVNRRACVKFRKITSEWFPVQVGLHEECVTSPWLFNIYMDSVVRKANAKIFGRGLNLVNSDDREWKIN